VISPYKLSAFFFLTLRKKYLMKLLAFFAALLFIPVAFSSAKDKHKHKKKSPVLPVVRVGNINSYMTTRAEILANPRLTIDSPCAIAGFSVSLIAPGHDFFGPIYAHGTDFTEQQISLIKEWDYPHVTLYIEDIHCNCHEQDYAPPAIVLKFDH
jgi:hypothetical protein